MLSSLLDEKHVFQQVKEDLSLKQIETNGSKHVTSRVPDEVVQHENKLTFKFFMTMLGFSMAFVVAEATPLFLVTCFTVIAYDLNAIDNIIWIIVAPYLATGAVAPFVGTLSDMLGRKVIILVSLAMGAVSFVILGATPNFTGFLVGQILSGAAIGIQVLTVIAAASELVPVAKRGATIGFIIMGFIPFAPAPLYGQLLAQRNWRYIFVLLGIWSVLSFIVLAIFYNPPPRPTSIGLTKRELLKRIDYVGCFLSVAGVVSVLIGINWGGQTYAWRSAPVISTIVAGLLCLVAFAAYEIKLAKFPMFPMRMIQSKRLFAAITVLCFTSGINYIPLVVFWTLQTFSVYGAGFVQAGIWLTPLGFCIAGGAVMSAILITVFKRHIQWVLLFFCIMQTVGIATMSLADPHNINTIWAPMILALFGVGAVLLPSQVVFSVISPDDLIGTSVALSMSIRMLGQIVGKAMFYNIFKTRLIKTAPAIIGIPAIQAGFTSVARITDLVETMTAGPLSHYVKMFPEIKTDADLEKLVVAGQKLYASIFPGLYLISIPFGALACCSCLALFGIHKYMDNHVAVHL